MGFLKRIGIDSYMLMLLAPSWWAWCCRRGAWRPTPWVR